MRSLHCSSLSTPRKRAHEPFAPLTLPPLPPPLQSPKHTKSEIREYLEKVYNVKVARVTTSITLGASATLAFGSCCAVFFRRASPPPPPPPLTCLYPFPPLPPSRAGKRKRVPGRRLIMRQRDYKRALVQLQDSSTLLPPPKAAAAAGKGPELR